MTNFAKLFAGSLLVIVLAACSQQATDEVADATPTETAEEFVARVNAELIELNREGGAAGWVRATYITEDTAIMSSLVRERYAAWHSKTVDEALQYDDQELSPETRRAIDLLKLGTPLPAPKDAAKRRELTQIATQLTGMYGAGKYCRSDNDCISGTELEGLMTATICASRCASSRPMMNCA
jgi:peptidyl-dipeptidase A